MIRGEELLAHVAHNQSSITATTEQRPGDDAARETKVSLYKSKFSREACRRAVAHELLGCTLLPDMLCLVVASFLDDGWLPRGGQRPGQGYNTEGPVDCFRSTENPLRTCFLAINRTG